MTEDFQLRRPQVVLSLCDYTGEWVRPYDENGYDVRLLDIQHGQDVRLLELPQEPIHGILAAPPCTCFANSGARWERSDEAMIEALGIVDACLRIVYATKPHWWALENPPGTLSRYLGPAQYSFDPNDFGDPYTKRTLLWGSFAPPVKRPVPATEGSKMHRLAPSAERTMLRSTTPAGFARAFYEANA